MTRAAGKRICHPCPIGQVRFLFPEGLRRLLPHPVCRPDVESCCRGKGPALLRTEFSRAHLPPACLLRPLHAPGLVCVAPGRGQGRCRSALVWWGMGKRILEAHCPQPCSASQRTKEALSICYHGCPSMRGS